MKNETTFGIELEQLQALFMDRKFEEGEGLVTRMLRDYNQFDYELLLQRARIRQCLMKHEEALADANLALQVVPNKLEAYHQLSDCLIATDRFPEAVKILEILSNSDPSNATITSQFEMLKGQQGTPVKPADTKKFTRDDAIQQIKIAAQKKKVRESSKAVSGPENFARMKAFIEEDRLAILAAIDQKEAEERKITPQEARQKRAKMVARNKKLVSDQAMLELSDEMSSGASGDEEVKLGPNPEEAAENQRSATFLETPSVVTPIDFSGITSEDLFSKRREVYRLKAQKLEGLVDCQLCKLIFDYTKTCNHFTMETDLKAEQLKQFARQSPSEKLQALAKITRSLDILSTARISSFMLKKQISELLAMYLQKTANVALSPHFKDFQAVECEKCQLPKGEPRPGFEPTIMALKILNRCFTFQIEAMVLNQTEDLLEQIVKENQREVTIREFAAEHDYTMAVSERLQEELSAAKNARDPTKINFELLYQLVRGFCNILILTQDQLSLVRSLHSKQRSADKTLSANVISVLDRIPYDLLSQNKTDPSKVMTKNQTRNFVLLITHSFRLLILLQSIDKNCLEPEDVPQMKTNLRQMLRKYTHFEVAFPLSKRLVDSLRADVLWFSHSTQDDLCKLTDFYQSEESKYQTCANCEKVDKGLKVCSRCRKAYYCDQVCQKTHYAQHKPHCVIKTIEMLTAAATALTNAVDDEADDL